MLSASYNFTFLPPIVSPAYVTALAATYATGTIRVLYRPRYVT